MGRGGTKGTHRIEFDLKDDINLIPGTQPNELIHQGALRNGRHGKMEIFENDF
ncbi:hypothetical protein SAMN06296036_112159 [Pseudobacteriovorax antillogorgiicola]|uniref:Uncharacterized protein n=1 Tax=Pseudobacteriovorax antillogorgiicola TaxID=1513793 RepID=A0A1Y6C4K4_9BACT|nr:hypothetical protein EDD56_112160 [Pseudobacteriovorax antillogorgiicola]SMF41396.1 hypothetical protein SAMN06296036_112159 [Pseudobacteriovorax antillogorgiicola]